MTMAKKTTAAAKNNGKAPARKPAAKRKAAAPVPAWVRAKRAVEQGVAWDITRCLTTDRVVISYGDVDAVLAERKRVEDTLMECGRFNFTGSLNDCVAVVDPELADLVTHWSLNMASRGLPVRKREIVAAYDTLAYFFGGPGSPCSPFFEKLSK
jgi:hypothetical protein